MDTSIRLSVETKTELDKMKVHQNQSYDEVIVKMLNVIGLFSQSEITERVKKAK